MLIKLLKIIWVLSSVAVIALTFLRYDPNSVSDIGIFLVYGMLFLAFPLSLVVAGLFALAVLLQEQLRMPILDLISSNYVGFSVMWLAFFAVGYLQWFVLLPWLWRKWKRRL
ncbi:MAG: hypothetical protein AB1545_16345 [Thermodesulfobacteriota bacterium]